MTCESFQRRFEPGTDDAALLAHLRACDPCLDFAAAADPEVMFRSLGGDEMIPPGGVDAFVDDVMRQVRVRGTESALAPPRVVDWPRRLAIAATIAAVMTGGAVLFNRVDAPAAQPSLRAAAPIQTQRALTTRPVVETYESDNATIVEMPSAEADDVKIVMIFDDNLPADL